MRKQEVMSFGNIILLYHLAYLYEYFVWFYRVTYWWGTRGGTEHDIRVVECDMLLGAVCLATETSSIIKWAVLTKEFRIVILTNFLLFAGLCLLSYKSESWVSTSCRILKYKVSFS